MGRAIITGSQWHKVLAPANAINITRLTDDSGRAISSLIDLTMSGCWAMVNGHKPGAKKADPVIVMVIDKGTQVFMLPGVSGHGHEMEKIKRALKKFAPRGPSEALKEAVGYIDLSVGATLRAFFFSKPNMKQLDAGGNVGSDPDDPGCCLICQCPTLDARGYCPQCEEPASTGDRSSSRACEDNSSR